MRWSWSVVVGLWVLTGCGAGNDPSAAWAGLKGSPAAPPATLVTVEPGAVMFPRTSVGKRVTTSVRIHNDGEGVAQVRLGIPEPFTVALTSLNLPPGAEQTVDLRLEPARAGPTGAVLLVQAGERRIEVTMRGEVDP